MRRVVVLAVVVLGLGSVAYANLFINGDFDTVDSTLNISDFPGPIFAGPPSPRPLNELPTLGFAGVYDSIPGWQTVAGVGIEVQVEQVLGIVPHSGLYYVELDSHPKPGLSSASAMAQTVTLNGLPYQFTIAAEGPLAGTGYGGLIDSVSLVQTASHSYVLSLFYMPRTSVAGQNGIAVYINGPGFPAQSLGTRVLTCDGVNDGSASWRECSVEFNTIPEPATYALVGAGLVALFFIRRRRS